MKPKCSPGLSAGSSALAAIVLIASLGTPGCTGVVEGDPASAQPSDGFIGGGGGPEPLDCSQPRVARAPLRRITRFEYNNTIRDLFGVQTRPADALPGEELGNGFGNDADALGVSRVLIDGYRAVAAGLAEELTIDSSTTVRTAGCDPVAIGEDACAQKFVTEFLGRAFRRPASPEDQAAYIGAFNSGREIGQDFASGVRAVIERALQAPQFLYRVELGEALDSSGSLARPTGYEMATRLSYLLWGSMPDPELTSAAQQGKLGTAAGVLEQAERMLAHPYAQEVVRYFHGHLLGTLGLDRLERNAEFYPTYRAGMGALFREETQHFLDDVIWNGSGDLAGIFTAPYTFVNETLAAFYGFPPVSGEAMQKVLSPDPARRAGILTQASILSVTTPGSRTDPVVRGKWIFSKLFCGKIADPPTEVPALPEPMPGLSVRDRLAMHRDHDACRGCHRLMDPIGFGFEHYDGVGLWRDMDNGLAVDDSGEIVGTDVDGPFKGVVELGQKLAQSQEVRNCFVGHWLTFAYGRTENEQDACTRASLQNAFDQAGGNVKALLLALTQTDAFLYRPVVVPGN